MKRLYLTFLLFAVTHAKDYCQPNQECWPTEEEIATFKGSLHEPTAECLEDFPTFVSQDDQGPFIYNTW